jgi:hypothetical protein
MSAEEADDRISEEGTRAIAERYGWQLSPASGLEAAVAEFKAALPGWWFSVGECQVSCDASCAPTTDSPDIDLIQRAGDSFDCGLHADLKQPATMADALRNVQAQALAAIKIARPANDHQANDSTPNKQREA